jgi:hypothetical protein
MPTMMKAAVAHEPGGPDVLKLEDAPIPSPGPAVGLTTYSGGTDDFMPTPLQDLAKAVDSGACAFRSPAASPSTTSSRPAASRKTTARAARSWWWCSRAAAPRGITASAARRE